MSLETDLSQSIQISRLPSTHCTDSTRTTHAPSAKQCTLLQQHHTHASHPTCHDTFLLSGLTVALHTTTTDHHTTRQQL